MLNSYSPRVFIEFRFSLQYVHQNYWPFIPEEETFESQHALGVLKVQVTRAFENLSGWLSFSPISLILVHLSSSLCVLITMCVEGNCVLCPKVLPGDICDLGS